MENFFAYRGITYDDVLLEPEIEYDNLIQVMDAIRSTEVTEGPNPRPVKVALFEDIAVGDAP